MSRKRSGSSLDDALSSFLDRQVTMLRCMAWEPEGPAWQYVLLDKLKPSIDVTLIEESLRRTPDERLRDLLEMNKLVEEVERNRGDRLPSAD